MQWVLAQKPVNTHFFLNQMLDAVLVCNFNITEIFLAKLRKKYVFFRTTSRLVLSDC